MEEEEKGFVIKDRRSLNEKGELKDKETEGEKKKAEPEKDASKDASSEEPLPLPEVNFVSFIYSLSSTALFHLGEAADPRTGEKKTDLPLAKHVIDTISMLKEKTEGNLTEEEKKFTETVLSDMRWRYIDAAK